MKENSFFLLSQHAKIIGYEIKLGQNAQGKIENNTIFKVQLKLVTMHLLP